MRKLILLLGLILTSCEQYVVEISDITLSGRYVVYQVDVIQKDSASQTFIGGQTYKSNLPHPFNNIKVNDFYMLFEGSGFIGWFKLGRMRPYSSNMWEYGNNRELIFNVYNNNAYNLGTLILTYKPVGSDTNRTMSFKIEEDGYEHLKLLSTGVYNNQANKTQIRLYLQREHP
jgi:hypothetical protein